jgi:Heterokaryon incompatibility protein (HET)
VDALCLIQDDALTMREGIQSMNFIYENALATVVAADGLNAETGLLRLSTKWLSKSQAVQVIKPGLRLTAIGALDVHLKKSKWSSRAWT